MVSDDANEKYLFPSAMVTAYMDKATRKLVYDSICDDDYEKIADMKRIKIEIQDGVFTLFRTEDGNIFIQRNGECHYKKTKEKK